MLNFSKLQKYMPYLNHCDGRAIFHGPIQNGVMNKVCLSLDEDALIEIQKEWDKTDEQNKKAFEANTKAREKVVKQVEEFCQDLGLPTYAKDPTGRIIIGQHAEFKMMLKQVDIMMKLEDNYPTKPVPVAIHSLNEDLKATTPTTSLSDFIREVKPLVEHQEQFKLEQQIANSKEAVKSQQVATMLREKVAEKKKSEANKRAWLYKNYQYTIDKPITISGCDDCSTWIFGHLKCSCGRTFVTYKVVGSIDNWSLEITTRPNSFAQPLIPSFSDIKGVKM